MITITISGPQGSGKSRLMRVISKFLTMLDYTVFTCTHEDGSKIIPNGTDVLITTKQECYRRGVFSR